MNRSTPLHVLNIILLVLVGLLLVWNLFPDLFNRVSVSPDPTAQPRTVEPRGSLAEDEQTTIEIFQKSSPSVVNVISMAQVRDRFTFGVQTIPQGTGSGFVWDEKGRIVTNYHVIKGASAIQVTLADHTSWNVLQKQFDEDKDLAVLWTDAPQDRLRPLPIGESAKLQVGQKVFAIGNPFALDQTLTTGIISALGRDMESPNHAAMKGMIQTDAAINPGNSGGPLLDSAGRLIGVNTAIISPSGSSAGIGFAIPVDEVNRVVPRLIRGEQNLRPGLGIDPAPDQTVRGLVAKGALAKKGVLILDVAAGGPAAKAGLRPTRRDTRGIVLGDLITAIDDQPVASTKELFDLLDQNYQIGQEVKVTFLRQGQGKEKSVNVTLGATDGGQ